ncbi:hypothetical protein BCU81_16800 [Vibrio breoganii]|nr:hypothetical protein BCU81_16800 [Vibrio breoganii]
MTAESFQGKSIQSSQYSGFKNKGNKGQHRGLAWRITITADLIPLKKALEVLKKIELIPV